MTNTDLMTFQNERPDPAFAATYNPEDELGGAIGTGYGVIGIKNGKWSIRQNKETHFFGTPTIDVIILRSPNFKQKSWYEGGYDDRMSAGKRPDCSSRRGDRPDEGVLKPQSNACGVCPRNVFMLQKNGKQRKECTDYIRLAVLVVPSDGSALGEPVLLRVPPGSLTVMANFGKEMGRKGHPYYSFVTRLGFDETVSAQKLTFQAVKKLTGEEAPVVLAWREDPLSYRITGESDNGSAIAAIAVDARSTTFIEQAPVEKNNPVGRTEPVGALGALPAPAPTATIISLPKKEEVDEVAILKARLAELERQATAANPVVEAAPSNRGPSSNEASSSAQADMADESDGELDDLVNGLLPR